MKKAILLFQSSCSPTAITDQTESVKLRTEIHSASLEAFFMFHWLSFCFCGFGYY